MQGRLEEKLDPDQDLGTEAKVSQDFYKQLKLSNDSRDFHKEEEAIENHDDDEEDESEEEEEEFSFMCGGADTSPIAAEDAFINGQIKTVFPLFNRDLFFSVDESDENLPMKPPVKKVFVETEDSHVTEVTSVEVSPDVCQKSNSTGFCKIWRFKDFMGRSNSDGRDAFVFLNNGHAPPSTTEAPVAVGGKGERKVSSVKINGKVKKGGKSKTASLSAHEVYLRSKAKGEEKRRSYLPYRLGFFTNVNSELSKNVHPF